MKPTLDIITFLESAGTETYSDPILNCLSFIKKNNWKEAHDIAENLYSDIGSWLHALLHRIEGDDWNARYWYRQANRSFQDIAFEEEWELIARSYLA